MVILVSFPRSLYVHIPGFRMDAINNVFLLGGFDLLATTFEYNFGIRPEHYLLTNFASFISIVDSLGGVDVNVGKTFHDSRIGYPDGCTVYPGIVRMNGDMALWYIRARMTTSDLDRLRRSQEVLAAIGQKLFNREAFEHIPDIYKSYRQMVVTDLSLVDRFRPLPLVQTSDPSRVERYTFTSDQVESRVKPTSQNFYLLPKQEANRQLLMQAAGNP
jgi:LCP family protein required for cell wall assembly